MTDILERKMPRVNGFAALLAEIAAMAATVCWFVGTVPALDRTGPVFGFWASLIAFTLECIAMGGFFVVQPNEAKVFTFFGRYAGSVRESGFSWTNPFVVRKSVSLKTRNFGSQVLKVNDAHGNPIEIAAIFVWRITDSAKALFSVDDCESFVSVQSETALRVLAGRFPYDSDEQGRISLRANQDEIALSSGRSSTRGSRSPA